MLKTLIRFYHGSEIIAERFWPSVPRIGERVRLADDGAEWLYEVKQVVFGLETAEDLYLTRQVVAVEIAPVSP